MQYFLMFLEGFITFISPCLLPMLPVYVSYFAGGSDNRSAGKTFANAVAFVLGFTVVFVLLGALAGTLGGFLSRYQTAVNVVTGLVVVVFGLHFFGLFRLDIFKGMGGKGVGNDMGLFSSFLFGIVFSVGWTPCVGAFLGSALMMASARGQMIEGIVMLLIYSLGLGIPFVISAMLIDRLKGAFNVIKRNYRVINIISGAVLVVVGVLMMTGFLGRFLALMS